MWKTIAPDAEDLLPVTVDNIRLDRQIVWSTLRQLPMLLCKQTRPHEVPKTKRQTLYPKTTCNLHTVAMGMWFGVKPLIKPFSQLVGKIRWLIKGQFITIIPVSLNRKQTEFLIKGTIDLKSLKNILLAHNAFLSEKFHCNQVGK